MASDQQSPTSASQQPQITSSGPKKVGAPLGTVPVNRSPSHRPDLVGKQFGSVKICSPVVEWRKWRLYVYCQCVTCSDEKWLLYTNLTGGRTKGCRRCNQPKRFPTSFYGRMNAAKQRCENPNDQAYERYGARGIRFNFPTVTDAALWVRDNLGFPPEGMEIDRIDNNGHYEPGNLRWSTRSQNLSHTRRSMHNARMHAFRQKFPEVRYADATLRRLFYLGMTDSEVIERFFLLPSSKPKGKYGTFSTPDPFIASLHKGS